MDPLWTGDRTLESVRPVFESQTWRVQCQTLEVSVSPSVIWSSHPSLLKALWFNERHTSKAGEGESAGPHSVTEH